MSAPSVRSECEGGVATLTIDREAKRNALDRETLGALEDALDAAARDPEVRVIVLRGAGDRVFCAEYQTSMRYLREMVVPTSRTEYAQEGIRAFFEKRKPVWKGR